jgi:3',5'-cyclic AMP phosphodiesterase CpdA
MNNDATYVEIIHLSDLHYGERHVFSMERTPDGRKPPAHGMPTLADKLIADLTDPAQQPELPTIIASEERENPTFQFPPFPKIVCISGDLTQKGTLDEFRQVELLVERLRNQEELGVRELDRIFFTPGNHDLNWRSTDDVERWDQFAGFLTRVTTKVHLAQDAAMFGGVQISHATKTVVLSLNSETKVMDEAGERSRGDLHPMQLAWARQQLEQLPDEIARYYIKIAMVHHHVVLLPSSAEAGRGYDSITGADKLLPMLHEHGFHVVLHGHKHYPHTFREDVRNAFIRSDNHSLFIVAGGTCGSTELPSPQIATQCYNRIRVHWCAREGTTRVQVVTRGLVRFKESGGELMPDQWHWKTLSVDDRHHLARRHPAPSKATRMRYGPRVSENSAANLARQAEYVRTHGYFPVAEILPAMLPGQTAEVHLRIVRHPDATHNAGGARPEVMAVTWSGGSKWFPSVRVTREDDADFRAIFAYFGGALLQAETEFSDGTSSISHVYVPMLNSQSAQ